MENKERLINDIYKEVLIRLEKILNQSKNGFDKQKIVVFGKKNDFLNQNFHTINFYNSKITTDEIDSIYITHLSSQMLSSIANLIATNEEEKFILEFLSKGKEIFIFKENIEYKKYVHTLPKEVYKKYLSFENILKSYNIKFINEIMENNKSEKLLSINNIKNYIINNKIILDKDMIISPLAKDFIRENNIILERR